MDARPSLTRLLAALPRWRLQTRLGLAVGMLMLLLSLGVAMLLLRAAEREYVRLASSNLSTLGDQMARELSAGMDRLGLEVQTQALRDLFREDTTPVAAMRQALDDFQRLHPEFAHASIVDAQSGRVLAATGGVFEGGSGRGRPTFERGKEGLFLGDVHDAVRLAELLPKPPDGEALRFLDVAAPIHDASGRVVRVLAAHVAWGWTDQVRTEVFGPVGERRGVQAVLVDSENKVVLASGPSLPVGTRLGPIIAAAGAEATRMAWADGRDDLTVVAATRPVGRFPGFGWKVVARQPYADVVAPITRLGSALLTSALGLGLFGALSGWWLTGRLVRPVRLLAEAAQREEAIAAGSTAFATPPGDELQTVQHALHRLADRARTQAQAADASERRFDALVRTLPQAVWIADSAGVVRFVNRDALAARAAPPDDEAVALGALQRLAWPQDRPALDVAWRQAQSTRAPLRLRLRMQSTPDAPARWVDCEARPVHAVASGHGAPDWIGTLVDVDESVQATQRSARALDAERESRSQAERLIRMRDEFIATVSHELRSPLTAMLGWSDILRRRHDEATVAKAAEVIGRNARLQSALIDDLIDMSAALAGKLAVQVQSLDLAQAARDAVASQAQAAEAKGVTLAMDAGGSVQVLADPRRLAQVLANLVGNAIKFTAAVGRIDLRVWSEGASGVVRVRDTGCGIAPDFLPFVFDRLRQEDASHTRRAGGLGLGLAISKALVELQGGRINAHSDGANQGATFTVALKCATSATAPTDDPDDGADAPGSALAGLRVLVVDDESDPREFTRFALDAMGADVRAVGSAAEALVHLAAEPCDALVSDIAMPEMDGLALIRAVRLLPDPRAAHVPAIALTAFAMEDDRRAGLLAGFQGYVVKPVSLRHLYEAIVAARRHAHAAPVTTDGSARGD